MGQERWLTSVFHTEWMNSFFIFRWRSSPVPSDPLFHILSKNTLKVLPFVCMISIQLTSRNVIRPHFSREPGLLHSSHVLPWLIRPLCGYRLWEEPALTSCSWFKTYRNLFKQSGTALWFILIWTSSFSSPSITPVILVQIKWSKTFLALYYSWKQLQTCH